MAERAFDLHFDRLHSLFRLSLANPDAAEAALLSTLGEVVARVDELQEKSQRETEIWLDELALAEIARRRQPSRQAARGLPVAVPRPLAANELEFLHSLGDETLAIMIRGLEGELRVVVALGLVHGIDTRRVALVLGCSVAQVELMQRTALGQLAELLGRHEHERFRRGSRGNLLARTTAPHLRPRRPAPSDGVIVMRGVKAMVVGGPPHNLYDLIRGLIDRLLDKVRRQEIEEHLRDDVGKSADRHSRKAPAPTPTTRPFSKPGRTAGQRDYRLPEPTRGTSVHDRSPKATPTTGRMNTPRKTLTSGAAAYNWTRNRGSSGGR